MSIIFEERTNSSAGRFANISRDYSIEDVNKLSGSVKIEYTLAKNGANQLWHLLNTENYVPTLGAMTGNQALQQVRAGLKSIYLSGWQVAADSNTAGSMYPDQSIYPANSGSELARRINNTLLRADEVDVLENGEATKNWMAPIVADCEAGFGGALNAYEITKSYISAGAAGGHFEDQNSSEKKCGHMGGKVLIPVQQAISNLNAARLAADVCGVSTIIMARTDADSAKLITTDIDPRDKPFISGERTEEGFYRLDDKDALDRCIARGLAFAPYADLLWMETSKPDLKQAEEFANSIRSEFPNQMLAYNCSSSFNWASHMNSNEALDFQSSLGKLGFKFQFITLAGFHSLNHAMFQLADDYKERGMAAYMDLQNSEFAAENRGFTAHRHQREVGASWFDAVSVAVKGNPSTTALEDSTENSQFVNEQSQKKHNTAAE